MEQTELDEPYGVTMSVDRDGTATVALAGDIDVEAAPALRAAVANSVASGATNVRFDMSRVDFIDSSGIGALLDSRVGESPVRLVAPSLAVLRLIELTGLSEVLVVDE